VTPAPHVFDREFVLAHSHHIREVVMSAFIQRASVLLLALLLVVFTAQAGDAKAGQAPKNGFRAEMLGQVSDVEKKIEDLAEAIPAEKYGWRPGEGVRSVSEVFVHIASSNYFMMTFLGVKPPAKMDPSIEKTVTAKDDVMKLFKPSFDHIRTAILSLSDKDLEKTVEMFGSTVTYRNALVTTVAHLHEHLGQSIAYARMNGVVPPWTAAEQAAAAKKGSK
jgi:uncharacterized damage-inducible protein DinB